MQKQQTNRAKKPLTAAAALKLNAVDERREVPDGRGLYLVIQKSGTKSWVFRYRSHASGRSTKLTLGPVDLTTKELTGEPVLGQPLSLAAARQLVSALKRSIALGKDPAVEKRQERVRPSAHSYADAVVDYVDQLSRSNRTWKATSASLGLKPDNAGELRPTRGGLCERWREKPVASLTEDDLFAVIDESRRHGIPGLGVRIRGPKESRARSMHAALSAMFGWLKDQRRIKANPLSALKRPKASVARGHTLSDDEIRKFWAATESLIPAFRNSLRLMLLTGQRRGEVTGMRRSELNDDLSVWTIPATRTKNKLEHIVPLPPLARNIIANSESIDNDLIFTTTGKTPVSGWSKMKKRLDRLMGDSVDHWRIHDLRRTAVTGMARAGADLHVIERAVNHTSGTFGGIVGVYQQHKYADDVKRALDAWANLVVTRLLP
jgi:site-specific recombinase XerD